MRPKKEINADAIEKASQDPNQIPIIAAQAGVSEKTIQRRISQGLNFSFSPDEGDISIQTQNNPTVIHQEAKPVIDYRATAEAFVTMIEKICSVVPMFLKDYEWESITPAERSVIVNSMQLEKGVLEFIAQNAGMAHLMGLGMLGISVASHFKKKPKEVIEKRKREEMEKRIKSNIMAPYKKTATEILKEQALKNVTKEIDNKNSEEDEKIEFLDDKT